MRMVSSILRIVCGLALLIMAWSVHAKNAAGTAAGEQPTIFGLTLGASPGQLTLAFVVIGLIGTGLIVLGLIGLLKQAK